MVLVQKMVGKGFSFLSTDIGMSTTSGESAKEAIDSNGWISRGRPFSLQIHLLSPSLLGSCSCFLLCIRTRKMSSVDSLSYTSEVSNDSSSGSEIHEIPSNQGPTKKSKSKRNKGKGKWRKKKDSSLVNIDTASSLLSKKEFQSSFEKIVDLLEYDGLIAEIKPENEALVNFLSTPATVQVSKWCNSVSYISHKSMP